MRGCEAAVERRSSYATLCSSCAVLCGTYPGVSGQRRIRRRSYAEHRSLRGTFPWSRPALIPTASWGLPLPLLSTVLFFRRSGRAADV